VNELNVINTALQQFVENWYFFDKKIVDMYEFVTIMIPSWFNYLVN
jgi:hypothetical protein